MGRTTIPKEIVEELRIIREDLGYIKEAYGGCRYYFNFGRGGKSGGKQVMFHYYGFMRNRHGRK
jgi:hypothetical protein